MGRYIYSKWAPISPSHSKKSQTAEIRAKNKNKEPFAYSLFVYFFLERRPANDDGIPVVISTPMVCFSLLRRSPFRLSLIDSRNEKRDRFASRSNVERRGMLLDHRLMLNFSVVDGRDVS